MRHEQAHTPTALGSQEISEIRDSHTHTLLLTRHNREREREMGSIWESKPHAVMIPYPAQGHVNPMMKLAKILHSRGFHITFVNSEFNHKRLLRSRGPHAVDGLPDFRYETIPDGLPPSDADATQHIPSLCKSTSTTCFDPFLNLLRRLQTYASACHVPPVTCVVSDGVMTFAVKAANVLGIPSVLFWTASACGFVGYAQYRYLVDQGLVPLKDESDITNGFLETKVDWVPGIDNLRLRDIPSFIRTTDPDDIMLNYFIGEVETAHKASIIVINTFDEFEQRPLQYLSSVYAPPIFTVGPLPLILEQTPQNHHKLMSSIGSNLWKEDTHCLPWLDSQEPGSVFYVNYGSITTMTSDELAEFAWGLADSKCRFLWVVRPDLVDEGGSVISSDEFREETEGRGLIVSWCSQEEVLNHPAVGGFLTHCGWNSTTESVCAGKPVVCWPFFAEQQTNCRYACVEWGTGMEVGPVVKRDEVRRMVVEVMEGSSEKGKEMKQKALEWKRKAEEATMPGGSSHRNLEKVLEFVLRNFRPT
ncbi:7-deoxyloganetin glucosyltransferase-like [Prosopis cineraria]|uniref:7-deoxyloganetin glucosyltransferase-like n=1 Tax=Prosopis cineraria TaxID=364024 RepID=UPI002410ABE4|nr:7-deoxyloganetin glucosyltransferase-like [Prosopis cineraria]